MMISRAKFVAFSIKICMFLSLFTLFYCGQDETMEDMEDTTSNCLEEVSFDEDGTTVTFPVLNSSGRGPEAIFQLKDPSPFDPDGVSRAFALVLQSNLQTFNVALEIGVPDAESCIPLGSYSTGQSLSLIHI